MDVKLYYESIRSLRYPFVPEPRTVIQNHSYLSRDVVNYDDSSRFWYLLSRSRSTHPPLGYTFSH